MSQDMTPQEIIANAYESRERLILHYGDTETGRDYDEVHDVEGYIGRSIGTKPIYLLVYNRRAMGGGAILMDSVVKIETAKGRRTLYQHPKYYRNKYCAVCGLNEPNGHENCKDGTPTYDVNTGWPTETSHKHKHPR